MLLLASSWLISQKMHWKTSSEAMRLFTPPAPPFSLSGDWRTISSLDHLFFVFFFLSRRRTGITGPVWPHYLVTHVTSPPVWKTIEWRRLLRHLFCSSPLPLSRCLSHAGDITSCSGHICIYIKLLVFNRWASALVILLNHPTPPPPPLSTAVILTGLFTVQCNMKIVIHMELFSLSLSRALSLSLFHIRFSSISCGYI